MNETGKRFGPYETRTDEELVQIIVTGQPEVFAELYERYYSRLYRLAYGMTGRHDLAEDLAQEVFIRAYQKLGLFGGQSSYSTWFYRLALNHCLNHCKSARRRKQAETIDSGQPALTAALRQMEKNILQHEMQDQIHRALLSLKPKYRLIVILRDIENLSYEEIAERVNCSTGTLASQLRRARKLLARKLEHLKGAF
ncbi:MAG: sigma-70 family RNA polymerase sigma factor [Blastocatellia bacterium]